MLTVKSIRVGELGTAVCRLLKARRGWVYRGLSIIEQAPLGGFGAPPSP